MTPLELYKQQLQAHDFRSDARQLQAMQHLQRVYDELLRGATRRGNAMVGTSLRSFAHPTTLRNDTSENQGFLKNCLTKYILRSRKNKPIRGVYLWGSVGAGKTWLMDMFYQTLPTPRKLRLHFHRFMRRVHRELTQLQGQVDPLKIVARNFAAQTQIICLDEFLVTDIADAMLLANLLQALFAEGITLIITANVAPNNLYQQGAQRENFLPAIQLLQQHLEIVNLQSAIDYRLRPLEQVQTYYSPLTQLTAQNMQQAFLQLTQTMSCIDEPLQIEGRFIEAVRLTNEVVWFDFSVLCSVPRSQLDYLEIARCFHTVFLSNVPQIASDQDNLARYLISLVDVFYDARVKLIISAAVSLEELYLQGRLSFEFQRAKSRLIEMQSREYLSSQHLG